MLNIGCLLDVLLYGDSQVRKLAASQNITRQLETLGASELTSDCLINSFKLFSTKHESFV